MERVLIDGVEQGTVAILQVLIVGVMLFLREPWLATLTMLPIPLLVTGALIYTLTAKSRYRLQRQAASAMNSLLHDNLSGVRQIKAYVRERQEHRRFNEMSMRLKEATLVVMKAWALYSPAMDFLTSNCLVDHPLRDGRKDDDHQGGQDGEAHGSHRQPWVSSNVLENS